MVAGSLGNISYLLFLYVYYGMSIGSTVGISSIYIYMYVYYIIMNTYIETIDEVQKIEEVIMKDRKLKRFCNSS